MTGTVKVKLHISAIALGRKGARTCIYLSSDLLFDLQVSGIKFSYESW